jgi:hypothetical protein
MLHNHTFHIVANRTNLPMSVRIICYQINSTFAALVFPYATDAILPHLHMGFLAVGCSYPCGKTSSRCVVGSGIRRLDAGIRYTSD